MLILKLTGAASPSIQIIQSSSLSHNSKHSFIIGNLNQTG
jgi:hypothetical protein